MDTSYATPTPSVSSLTDPFNMWSNGTSNGSHCPESEAWDWLYTMQPVYMVVISVLGIVGNVFVLTVFCFHKKPCTVAEIYLSNLAAADLLLLSCLPFWAANVANGFNWQFGDLMCRLVNAGIKMNMYSSIYFLVLVSADRYVALVHAMSHGRMRRPRYAKLSCLAVWCLGLLLSVPVLNFRKVQHVAQYNVTACMLDFPSPEVELACDVMLILLGFAVPLAAISYCTYRIIHALHTQRMERFNAENTERKATVLVLAVLLAFLLCWIPLHLLTIVDILWRLRVLSGCALENALDICSQLFTYLAFINSLLNPILYVIVGKNFRKKVRELAKQINLSRKKAGSTKSQLSTLKTFASN
ncbi:B2 bradykinin receptor-like [Clupea harengus]|uniref:B2 bradykinin receptor n=1 Tax=Clupea harengus TaxID=7950 RepID=A0A6P3VQ04_CLUHA|nr:B2 bradykinin receptor-like [Clupea harengus]